MKERGLSFLNMYWIYKRSHLLASLKSVLIMKGFLERCCISLLLNCAYFPGSSFLSLSLLLLFLLLLLSEVDSPLSVLVSSNITSAAFSLRTVARQLSSCLRFLAGLHTWLVHALFDRHLGSWDAFTHGSSYTSLFGHIVCWMLFPMSGPDPGHYILHQIFEKYSWARIGLEYFL